MRGQIFKDPILSKAPAPESPVQIVSDHFPPHPEMTEVSGNLTAACEQEIKETLMDLPDVSSHKNEVVPEHHDSNTALLPYK